MGTYSSNSYINNLIAASVSDKKAKDAATAAAVKAASKNAGGSSQQTTSTPSNANANIGQTSAGITQPNLVNNLYNALNNAANSAMKYQQQNYNINQDVASYQQQALIDFLNRQKAAVSGPSLVDTLNKSLSAGNAMSPSVNRPNIFDVPGGSDGSDGESTGEGTTGGAYWTPPAPDYLPDPSIDNLGGGGGSDTEEDVLYYPFYGGSGSGGYYDYASEVSKWYQYMTQWNIGRK
jgi:hypothetical protein